MVVDMRKTKNYLSFPEPIIKMFVRETVGKDGCKCEELIINDKWKMIPKPGANPPFRYKKI